MLEKACEHHSIVYRQKGGAASSTLIVGTDFTIMLRVVEYECAVNRSGNGRQRAAWNWRRLGSDKKI